MPVDMVLVAFVVVMLVIVFAFYLMLRRTVLEFSEGVDRGRR